MEGGGGLNKQNKLKFYKATCNMYFEKIIS